MDITEQDDLTDRAVAMVGRWLRPSRAGLRPGVSPDSSLIEQHYDALVAAVRDALASGACPGCGGRFCDEQDVHLDRTALPSRHDGAPLPERHRWLLCASCAWSKRYGLAASWIAEQLRARRPVRSAEATARRRRSVDHGGGR
jgi:hypothetical protein